MKLIRPTNITDAMLISCDIPETDAAVYSAGTTYALGAKVILTTGVHRVYESLQNANTNHAPTSSPEWWLDLGATNRWAMFDQVVGSQSTQADSFTVVLAPGNVDSLVLLDIDAVTVAVTMTDPVEGEVFSDTINLSAGTHINDAWEYFFSPIILRDALVLLGLPPYPSAQIEVTVQNTGGDAKAGTLVVGLQATLGKTRYDPSLGITDYSRKEVDAFGQFFVVERAYSKKMSCSLVVENSSVDYIARLLAQYRATPVCWVGADELFSSMIIYGFYKSFDIVVTGPQASSCTIEVEGLS